MELNANFDERIAVHSEHLEWQASPMPGVDRRMLDRLGDEVARATSIVRYAPNSHFSPHVHTGGEEFLVLDGVFQDEHGDFPAGSYIRNPPESSHTPGSDQGCTIFVKLWQFDLADRTQVRIDTNQETFASCRQGVSVMPLFQDANEVVSLEQWEPGTSVNLTAPAGLEILVLAGEFTENHERLEKHAWLRLPAGRDTTAHVGEMGARVWIKRGHLSKPPQAPAT